MEVLALYGDRAWDVMLFVYYIVITPFGISVYYERKNQRPSVIRCWNCDCTYIGPCRREHKNIYLLVFLIIVFIPAVLVYTYFVPDRTFCPKCGQDLDDHNDDTPFRFTNNKKE